MTRSGLAAALVLASTMLLACTQSASVLHDGRVLLVGGGTAAIFDPASDTIVATGSPAFVRTGETATVLADARVLLTGGAGAGSDEILASAELYDPETGRFSSSGSMATPRYLHSATLLDDGRVLVVGGTPTAGLFSDREVTPEFPVAAELFDPATDTWRPTGELVRGRIGHTATLLPDGRVLVVGGMDADGGITAAELYDPSTETFAVTGSLATARAGHTATPLGDGRVLVVGGSGPAVEDLDDQAELYDPATGRFEPAGRLTAVRFGHTATLLPDGRVLIAGGLDLEDGEELRGIGTVETWHPSSLASTGIDSMTVPRAFHTASRLDDGRVLIVGGDLGESVAPDFSSGAFDVSASSWEVYDPATGSFEQPSRDYAGPPRSAHAQTTPTATRSEDLYVVVTASGEHPPGEWDAESFVGGICGGSLRVDEIEPMVSFPTSEILVAKQAIEAGDTIEPEWLDMRAVPLDVTTSDALRRPADAVGSIAAVDILEHQPIMPNLLENESAEPSEE